MAGKPRQPEADRFMSHVAKCESGCWLWTAYCMPNGYGNFRTPEKHELAHRASYRLFVGLLQDGMDVMHSCDTPSCVNPEHLQQGTRLNNMADAKAKGRNARGESHGRSFLSEGLVTEIRSASMTQREIADIYGISQGHVNAIRTGKRWAQGAQGANHR